MKYPDLYRLATGVILSKEVYFQQLNYRFKVIWDFLFFLHMGLSKTVTDMVLMEWMKIQYKLKLLSQVTSFERMTPVASLCAPFTITPFLLRGI
jgi:hypothetical protein